MALDELIIFVPDCHIPYHDKRAWSLFVRSAGMLIQDAKARGMKTRIVVLGDFIDMYAVSSHDKNPTRANNLEWEIQHGIACRQQLDCLGADVKEYVNGNHEDRLERYLMKKAPEMFNMVKVDQLLRLKEHGWKFTPYKAHSKIGHIYATHECGNAGPLAASKARDKFQGNVVIGHTHRMAVSYQGNARGEAHVGAMFGWLGDVSQIDYMHSVGAAEWQLGFGVAYKERSGVVHLQAIPIIDYTCVVNGQLVHDRAPRLVKRAA